MDSHSIKILEYKEILNLLSLECGSFIAKEKAMDLEPSCDMEKVNAMLDETEEAFNILEEENIPVGGIRDIRESLKILSLGGRLKALQLLDISQTLSVGTRILAFFSSRKDKKPSLYNLTINLKSLKNIQNAINSAIDPKGEIYSNASRRLASLRRSILDLRNSITSRVEDILKSADYRKMLQEPIFTTRQGRYVLPVKSEYKNRFKGIVHDQSSSGVTVFMEPLALIEKTNKLKQAELEEVEEIEKILKELSEAVSLELESIKNNLSILTELDLIIARAKLSHKVKGSRPIINKNKTIKIINGRHPLITGNIVPISLELGEKFKCLVITGPNTGGKTVTLKMAGLFSLMAQSGLFIPADEGSGLFCFNSIYADIGDEQSIAQSLSTFSSHISQIAKILEKADRSSIVLLDELGAGTDPSEGALLAIAILEEFIKKDILCIVTSHHNRLKAFAALHPEAENASVDFDLETLMPTYNLLIGQPGRSQALYIAEKLGIPSNIINNARENLSEASFEIDNLLEQIKLDSEIISEEKETAFFIKRETEKIKKMAQEKIEQEEFERKKNLEKFSEESKKLLASVKKEVDFARKTIKKLIREQKDITPEETLKIIDELQDKLNLEEEIVEEFIEEIIPPPPPPLPVKAVRVGDYVRIISLGHQGFVTDVPEKAEEIKVQVGMMIITARLSDLAKAHHPDEINIIEQDRSAQKIETSKILSIPAELKLISKRAEEAIYMLEKYLEDATLAGHKEVRIVHGKGTGVLRNVVKEYLRNSPLVSVFRLGGTGEGGSGVTIAELGEE